MSATPARTTSYEGNSVMTAKKKSATADNSGLQTLKISSRVRCTDDQAEGRIVWANGVSVKIKWDDGEQVTWRRDSLAGRPIEILCGDEDEAAAPAAEQPAPAQAEQSTPAAASEPTTTEPSVPTPEPEAAAEAPPQAPEPTEAPNEPAAAAGAPTAATELTAPAAPEDAPDPATDTTEAPPEATAASEPTHAV